jgi:hypothetical protein
MTLKHFVQLIAVGVLLATAGTAAQTVPGCTPQRIEYLLWGADGAGQVPTPGDPVGGGYPNGGYVPDGEVWLIDKAGISSTIPNAAEFMLEVQHKVWSQNNVCCWLIPAMRMTGAPSGTPTLALDRPLIMPAGDRLGARVNGITSSSHIGLFYTGWKFPAGCTAALLLPGPTNITIAPPTDFSAMTAAALSLEQAAAAIKTSIPR